MSTNAASAPSRGHDSEWLGRLTGVDDELGVVDWEWARAAEKVTNGDCFEWAKDEVVETGEREALATEQGEP